MLLYSTRFTTSVLPIGGRQAKKKAFVNEKKGFVIRVCTDKSICSIVCAEWVGAMTSHVKGSKSSRLHYTTPECPCKGSVTPGLYCSGILPYVLGWSRVTGTFTCDLTSPISQADARAEPKRLSYLTILHLTFMFQTLSI